MATKITGTNTAAAPGVTGDDTDTGLFYGTNEIGFSTGGTSRLTLDSSGYLNVPDSGKIRLGTDNDLEIYHNGSHGFLDSNTGDLRLLGDDLKLMKTDGSSYYVDCNAGGSVDLFHNNVKKAETAAGGFTVTGVCTATSFAGSGASLTNLPSSAVGKNLLYNGEMQVHQRGGTSTSGYGLDRWKTNFAYGAFNVTQDSESPNNFAKSLKIDCTTSASMSGAGNISVQQHLEGLDLQGIGAGTSDAKSLTLSFWVRSTKTGVFNTILYQKDGGKFAVQNTTISSANTWEKKTFTVAGNTADAIANDNTKSLTVEFWLDAGTSYRGGTVSGSWNTWADNEAGEGITLNLGDSTSNDFYLTGVKLETGTAATDYDYQAYGDELKRCQRYYEILAKRPGDGQGSYDFMGMWYSGSEFTASVRFQVDKRAVPTFEQVSGTNYYTCYGGSVSDQINSWTGAQAPTVRVTTIYNNNTVTGGTTGHAGWVGCNNDAAVLAVSAEL